MKDKWNKNETQQQSTGQPVGLLYSYKFSGNKWPLSLSAIDNYNRIPITQPNRNTDQQPNDLDRSDENEINSYQHYQNNIDNDVDTSNNNQNKEILTNDPRYLNTITSNSDVYLLSDGYPYYGGSESVLSGLSAETATIADSERTDPATIGSTMKLTENSNAKNTHHWSWLPKIERGLNCISLAACFGNIVRLPVTTMLHGGIPFLVAYLLLLLFVGLPLVFLELGIGQIVQQGLTKTWRAVPMFRGVGYVKLLANVIVCIYYPLYIGLASYYFVWSVKGSVPFTECSHIEMTKAGYRNTGIPGESCLNKTFLKSPFVDPKWFGFYVGFLAFVWLIIMLCSFRKIKLYMRSMNCFFIPTFLCLIILLIRSVQLNFDITNLYQNIDWSLLLKAEIWYYAIIQLFYSTHLGFGNIVTCAGKIYNKADPFRAALAYILFSMITGGLSVITCYILVQDLSQREHISNITELYLFSGIYDSAIHHSPDLNIWIDIFYVTIFLSGFISMLTVMYTILKAIRVETKRRWHWSSVTVILSLIFFSLGVLSILVQNFKIVHLFDHYVVGNLLLLTTILEVIAFAYFYGCSNIYMDFEFILGSSLTCVWKVLWYTIPVVLIGVFIWALVTIRLTGFESFVDPLWMYTTGWTIIVASFIFILIFAVYEVYVQVDYNFVQKFTSALKASRKWGPVDPMLRHGWIQWRSTAGTGDRDFTLKRRGTRDYTHSIKNRRRTAQTQSRYESNSSGTVPNTPTSSNNNTMLNKPEHTLEVVSIMDTLERIPKAHVVKKSVLNPLALETTGLNDSNSEGYGTIRNGPYVISNDDFDHVCWRRTAHEDATEF